MICDPTSKGIVKFAAFITILEACLSIAIIGIIYNEKTKLNVASEPTTESNNLTTVTTLPTTTPTPAVIAYGDTGESNATDDNDEFFGFIKDVYVQGVLSTGETELLVWLSISFAINILWLLSVISLFVTLAQNVLSELSYRFHVPWIVASVFASVIDAAGTTYFVYMLMPSDDDKISWDDESAHAIMTNLFFVFFFSKFGILWVLNVVINVKMMQSFIYWRNLYNNEIDYGDTKRDSYELNRYDDLNDNNNFFGSPDLSEDGDSDGFRQNEPSGQSDSSQYAYQNQAFNHDIDDEIAVNGNPSYREYRRQSSSYVQPASIPISRDPDFNRFNRPPDPNRNPRHETSFIQDPRQRERANYRSKDVNQDYKRRKPPQVYKGQRANREDPYLNDRQQPPSSLQGFHIPPEDYEQPIRRPDLNKPFDETPARFLNNYPPKPRPRQEPPRPRQEPPRPHEPPRSRPPSTYEPHFSSDQPTYYNARDTEYIDIQESPKIRRKPDANADVNAAPARRKPPSLYRPQSAQYEDIPEQYPNQREQYPNQREQYPNRRQQPQPQPQPKADKRKQQQQHRPEPKRPVGKNNETPVTAPLYANNRSSTSQGFTYLPQIKPGEQYTIPRVQVRL